MPEITPNRVTTISAPKVAAVLPPIVAAAANLPQEAAATRVKGMAGRFDYEPILAVRKDLFDAIRTNYEPKRAEVLKSLLFLFEFRNSLTADYQTQNKIASEPNSQFVDQKTPQARVGERIKMTYEELTSFINSKPTRLYSRRNKLDLAEQMIAQIAEPRTINQGMHGTCNVTTVQIYTAAVEPQNYVRVTGELINKSEFRTGGGRAPFRVSDRLLMSDRGTTEFDLRELVKNWNSWTPATKIFQGGLIATVKGHERFDFVDPHVTLGDMLDASELVNGYRVPIVDADGRTTRANAEELHTKMGRPFIWPTMPDRFKRPQHVQVVFPSYIKSADGEVRYNATVTDDSNGAFSGQNVRVAGGRKEPPWMEYFQEALQGYPTAKRPIDLNKIFHDVPER